MMKYKNAQMTTEKVITFLMVAFVVAMVIGFIFKANITSYLKVLPDFKLLEEDNITIIDGANPILESKGCPTVIGKVVMTEEPEKRIMIDAFLTPLPFLIKKIKPSWHIYSAAGLLMSSVAKISLDGKETNLIWYTNKGQIALYRPVIPNIGVGKVDSNRVIYIYPDYIDNENMRKKYPELPISEEMKLLDGAYFYFDNKICKKTK